MTARTGRRAFIQQSCDLLALALPRPRWAPFAVRSPPLTALRVGLATSDRPETRDALQMGMGARLGADEATHSAALFGAGAVELVVGSIDDIITRDVAAVLSISRSPADCARLGALTAKRDMLLLNVACTDDVLRGGECRATTFHVMPSDAMLRDALTEARAHHAPALSENGVTVTPWDSSLDRFGADTLNTRFQSRFNNAMTAGAWCAWVAVKILAEASLRVHSSEAHVIAAYLRRDVAQFDGHKGRPLSFRPWDNQLRQPVYVMAPASGGGLHVVTEAPAANAADETSRALLDRIGTNASATRCRFSS